MITLIDTEPCETCDYARAFCGRDIEDCAINPSHKKTEPTLIVNGKVFKNVQLCDWCVHEMKDDINGFYCAQFENGLCKNGEKYEGKHTWHGL